MKNQILKKLTAIAAVTALTVVFAKGINFLVVDDTAVYARLMMHEFYEDDDVDTLLLGASLFFRGVDPYYVNEHTGRKTFDASTSAQPVDASLAILKEAVKTKHLKEVYYYFPHRNTNIDQVFKKRNNLTGPNIVSDYMPFSLNKVSFLLNASRPEFYVESFFPAKRETEKFLEPDYLADLWKVKFSEPYLNYTYVKSKMAKEEYIGKGFVASYYSATKDSYFDYEGFEPFHSETVSEDWMNGVKEIIRVCRENEIRLVIVGLPISDFYLAAEGNYDDFIAWLKAFLEPYDVDYTDFNLLSDECFQRDPSLYQDTRHMNYYGAEKFSVIFSDFLNGTLDPSVFVPTVKERIDAQETKFYGASLQAEGDHMNLRMICNHPEEIEYRVEVETDSGERYVLQDFSSNTQLSIPYEGSKFAFITYRINGAEPVRVIREISR